MTLTKKQQFMSGLIDEFKAFVLDSMAEGHDQLFPDHFEFIKACLDEFEETADMKDGRELEPRVVAHPSMERKYVITAKGLSPEEQDNLLCALTAQIEDDERVSIEAVTEPTMALYRCAECGDPAPHLPGAVPRCNRCAAWKYGVKP